MHRFLAFALLLLAGCGDASSEGPVDTTLPNDTGPIGSAAADLNAVEGMDTMTDNMTAVDGSYSSGMMSDDLMMSNEMMMSNDIDDYTPAYGGGAIDDVPRPPSADDDVDVTVTNSM